MCEVALKAWHAPWGGRRTQERVGKKERETNIGRFDVKFNPLALPCSRVPLMQGGVYCLIGVGNMPSHIRKSSVSERWTMWLLQRHQMVMPTELFGDATSTTCKSKLGFLRSKFLDACLLINRVAFPSLLQVACMSNSKVGQRRHNIHKLRSAWAATIVSIYIYIYIKAPFISHLNSLSLYTISTLSTAHLGMSWHGGPLLVRERLT